MGTSLEMVRGIGGHATWANERLLSAAENLTPAQLESDIPGGYGTVKVTFVHLISVQRGWLRRFQALDPLPPVDPAEFTSIDDVRTFWDELNHETNAYLSSLTEEDLQQVIHMKFWSGDEGDARRWQAFLHYGMHQHQHRGELAAVLTSFGYSPGELDVFDYFESVE